MKKEIWLLIVMGAIIVALLAIFAFVPAKPVKNSQLQKIDGLEIISPIANSEVSSPLKITGVVSGNGWVGFEGQVGTVKLLDYKGNVLAQTFLPATTEWTKLPTSFETTLNFDVPNNGPATLVFKNENASGEPSRDKTFILPIKISRVDVESMKIKVYFGKNEITSSNCNLVFPVEREVPQTPAVLKTALQELLKGPTEQEKAQGYFSSIPAGAKLNRVMIENRTAIADFTKELDPRGGSCRVEEIFAEIQNTAKQFPSVDEIIISIGGSTEEILQP